MRKFLFISVLLLFLLMSGCAKKESDRLNNPDIRSDSLITYQEKSKNQETTKNQTSEPHTYKIGELFIDTGGSYNYKSSWYFSGFIGQDTFAISQIKAPRFDESVSLVFFYPLEIGYTFTLSDTLINLKLVKFDLKNHTVTFEKVLQ